MKPFAEWDYQDAVQAIAQRKESTVGQKGYDANKAMVEQHDFWRNGDTWIGPRGTSATWQASIRAAIEKQHVAGAASIEALANFARGLLGKEPNIQFALRRPAVDGSDEDKKARQEAEELVALLSGWWDRVGLWRKLRIACMRSRWATWSTLRLWIPQGRLEENADGSYSLPQLRSMEEALEAIELSVPDPDHCIVLQHPDDQTQAAVFTFTDHIDGRDVKKVEMWYQDEDETIVRVLTENDAAAEEVALPWGGRLPVAELDAELMINETVRRQEAALSFSETNIVRVGETAGFRERYTMNAEPHGIWLPTPPDDGPAAKTSQLPDGSTVYLHALPRTLGPAVTTDLIGVKTKSGVDGEERATPGVHFADPVDPEFAIKGAEYRRARVLQLCGQGHLAMTSGAEASGFAYEQSRATFRGDLEWHKSSAERAITLLLESLLLMAESMTGESRKTLERFRIIVTLTVDPGPVSPDLYDVINRQVEKGMLSRPSGMARLGVEDVQAELDLINSQPESIIELRKKQIDALRQLVGEGMTWRRAGEFIGITDETQLKLLADQDQEDKTRRQQEDDEDDEIDDALRTDPDPQASAA